MARLELGPTDSLHYEYDAPRDGAATFVFVNALTGNTAVWQTQVGPALREAGFGTLAYNMRGQQDSALAPDGAIGEAQIVDDLRRLLGHVAPPRPVLVGLSIGGLFAARAILGGAAAEGLVLINTLRRPSARLDWINQAMVRAAAVGGQALVLDLYLPLLVNEDRLASMRDVWIEELAYEPLTPQDGHMKLLMAGASSDWDLPYEALDLPVLVLTGLRDGLFLVPDDVEALAARMPKARHVEIADAGHLIPAERPERLVQALLDFVDSGGGGQVF